MIDAATPRWEVWYTDPVGANGVLVSGASEFTVVHGINGQDQFEIVLPGNFDTSALVLDGRFEFWRAPTQTDKLALEFLGLMRWWGPETDKKGLTTWLAGGPGPTDLVKRRIVAFAAGTAEANKTGAADDVVKEIVRENLGAAAAAGRDLSPLGFTVQADLGDAPALTRSFSWQNVYPVLIDLSDSAWGAGTRAGFHIVAVTPTNLEFRTWTGQPGIDRTGDVVFGLPYNNLERPKLRYDYTREENHIYAGGDDVAAARNVREVSDDVAEAASVWNRREGFTDCRMETTDAGVDAAGEARLAKFKPLISFQGRLLDTQAALYGRDWRFGDKVLIDYEGVQLEVVVQAIKFVVTAKGEKFDSRVRFDS